MREEAFPVPRLMGYGAIMGEGKATTEEPHEGRLLYKEEQSWRQAWWAGPLMGLSGLAMVVLFGYGLFEQLIMCRPWGGRPAPDWVLALFASLMLVVGAGLLWLAVAGKLVTEVRERALCVQHYPLTRRHCYPWKQIASFEARRYRPIAEYGGWGVRGSWFGKGRAYNVWGSRGVQFVFDDGGRLLVGSQRAEELAQAIARAKKAADANS